MCDQYYIVAEGKKISQQLLTNVEPISQWWYCIEVGHMARILESLSISIFRTKWPPNEPANM
jgi:hypothetical protein